jgi:hypothetical protein
MAHIIASLLEELTSWAVGVGDVGVGKLSIIKKFQLKKNS